MTRLQNGPDTDEAEIRQVTKKIEIADSLNLIQVKRIFRQYGYPGAELARKESAHNF